MKTPKTLLAMAAMLCLLLTALPVDAHHGFTTASFVGTSSFYDAATGNHRWVAPVCPDYGVPGTGIGGVCLTNPNPGGKVGLALYYTQWESKPHLHNNLELQPAFGVRCATIDLNPYGDVMWQKSLLYRYGYGDEYGWGLDGFDTDSQCHHLIVGVTLGQAPYGNVAAYTCEDKYCEIDAAREIPGGV